MPPKKKMLPAPIDRPLSRAYLRQFKGWSTAYPPGLSDPASLRLMENVQVMRDGSARVRPGLRYLSFDGDPVALSVEVVGSHETFFLNDGSKALLFAYRIPGDGVGFKVLRYDPLVVPQYQMFNLTDPEIGFEIPQGEAGLALSEETTYVKYLQIDNKIFALGDAGDALRLFHVGVSKIAETVVSIDRPNWSTEDKLTIVHPESTWITAGSTVEVRRNKVTNPSFEVDDVGWASNGATHTRVVGASAFGTAYLRVEKDSPAGDPAAARADVVGIIGGEEYELSASVKNLNAGDIFLQVEWRKDDDTVLSTDSFRTFGLSPLAWQRYRTGLWTAPENATKARLWFRFREAADATAEFLLDGVLFERTPLAGLDYFDGDTPDAGGYDYQWDGVANGSESFAEASLPAPTTPPDPVDPKTVDTLISSDDTKNIYNFGYFYTFYNDIGESAASQVTIVRAQRPWTSWRWETPNLAGEPDGNETEEPNLCADQLVAILPEDVFDAGMEMSAKGWHLYMFTWSDQDSVPIEAALVASRELDADSTYGEHGWIRHTPQNDTYYSAPLPNKNSRYNYSAPSHAGQGIVAADRIILVHDPKAAAVIRWSSNNQGDYTNFTASRGGGYKTLTSGNLMIPACVKLWQNPQSADTLTILCSGVDGYSTAYYMAPAQVASQSDATNIMGFEETTATPGTVSPYGVEVMNNALYHPLDHQLMKSTASNYNINHKGQTDAIENMWTGLVDKRDIISSQLDMRLYLIVNNPEGEDLEPGCKGNELWVYDSVAKETGSWSRWLIQGCSLRTVEVNGQVYMSVVRPDGVFYLDPEYDRDDVVTAPGVALAERFIPWRLETNTQGANRAHDAWCHLQQANVVLGNFRGTVRIGLRGMDLNGRRIDKSKLIRDADPASPLPWDLEDYFPIQRQMKEWHFYAESVTDDEDVTLYSTGQINLVQYRYAPISVNVGYEYGSVETFEYGRAGNDAAQRTTDNGVPQPFIDTARP